MIKSRNDPWPSILRFRAGDYKHRFGGSPCHDGVIPAKHKVPMHLLMLLDMNDPLVPIEADDSGIRILPLYYPLRYGFGGGEVQYSVDSDSRITILSALHKEEVDNGEDYPHPDQFPECPASLVPLSYVQHRAIVASEHGSNHFSENPESMRDLQILKDLDYWKMVRFGDSFSPVQGGIHWPCQNKKCEWIGKHVRVDVFASFTGALTEKISIWGEYGNSVEIYFCLMSCCKTVTTVNRCT
jgi:hypothetical protein